MKKRLLTIILVVLFLISGCVRKWINSDQQMQDYINEFCPLPEGTIVSCSFLESGKLDDRYGDEYLKYLAYFDNGVKRLIQVNVTFHQHLLQRGPDYRIRSCHTINVTEIKTASFRYADADNDCVLLINADGTFLLKECPELNYYLNGNWSCDGQIMILNCDDRYLYFLVDENLLVYLDEPSDHFLVAALPDECVFLRIQ